MDRPLAFFLLAFILSAVATPLFGRLSLKYGLVDHPSSRRFHLTSMPLLGGVAVIAVFIALVPFAAGWEGVRQYGGILVAALVLTGFGLYDDVRGIPAAVKFAGQLAGALILILSGLMWRVTGIAALDVLITIVWVAGIINAMNLLDNIDGLSSGAAAVAGVFFFLLGVMGGAERFALIAIVFAGVCMGFLLHNFHPATVFMGDAGSMALGALLAGFGMVLPGRGDSLAHLTSAVVLGLLIFDTGLVSILRLANGKSIFEGGKDHTSHRLCAMGLSVQASVVILFGVSFFFGCCALVMTRMGHPNGLMIPFGLFMMGLTCLYLLKDTYDYGREAA
ncbi:MAG: MraY family glycosyltransferase [bacterium]